MALSVKAGQMKTRIYIKQMTEVIDPENNPLTDKDGFPIKSWENVFESFVWCHWHNLVGSQRDGNERVDLRENATVTIRYSPLVNVRCKIWLEADVDDANAGWEILTVNNVDMLNKFLEIKVRREVVG